MTYADIKHRDRRVADLEAMVKGFLAGKAKPSQALITEVRLRAETRLQTIVGPLRGGAYSELHSSEAFTTAKAALNAIIEETARV